MLKLVPIFSKDKVIPVDIRYLCKIPGIGWYTGTFIHKLSAKGLSFAGCGNTPIEYIEEIYQIVEGTSKNCGPKE